MHMETDAVRRLAEELTAAYESGDLAAIDRLYAPNFVLWRNSDNVDENRANGVQSVANLHASFAEIRLKNLKRYFFDGGYAQTFIFSGMTHEGSRMEGPMCMMIFVEDGKILRVDEYYDPAQDTR